jgi:hypothetical protein
MVENELPFKPICEYLQLKGKSGRKLTKTTLVVGPRIVLVVVVVVVFSSLTIDNNCFIHRRLCKDSRGSALEF